MTNCLPPLQQVANAGGEGKGEEEGREEGRERYMRININ